MFKKLLTSFMLLLTVIIAMPLKAEEEASFLKRNTHLVKVNRQKLINLSQYVQNNQQFIKMREKTKVSALTNDERAIIREAWSHLLNSHLELNLVIKAVSEKQKENQNDKKDEALMSEDYFTILYAAHLVQYRSAIDFIRAVRKISSSDYVLNEPVAELGLEKNTFSRFKFEYLNLEKFTSYSAYRIEAMRVSSLDESELKEGIDSDVEVISKFHRYKGFLYSVKNAGKIVTNLLFKMYFPLQKNISEWMGDERVARGDTFLINQKQVSEVHALLRAGDVLIERREWYLSNIGLPGFWPHAALYLGRPEERSYIEEDQNVQAWVKSEGLESGSFEELLLARYPEVYKESLESDNTKHPYRVLEAMSEGVVFTSIEHSANADSLAVIRPKLATVDIAKAIFSGLKYKGRPYDFNFDFRTDSEVVCSELIFYAYQPTANKKGINFSITNTLGRPVVTPNNIIKDFTASYGTDKQQFDLVLFLDGNDKKRQAVYSDIEGLKTTPDRPKWFIFIQK